MSQQQVTAILSMLHETRDAFPHAHVLVLIAHCHSDRAQEFVLAGASGVLTKDKPAAPPRVSRDDRAVAVLASAAARPVPPDPDDETLRELWRAARSRAHSDRNGGDRTAWDAVEQAARDLGIGR